jgi:hypothetical protein
MTPRRSYNCIRFLLCRSEREEVKGRADDRIRTDDLLFTKQLLYH